MRALLKLSFIGDAGVARVVREMERAVDPPVLRTIETPGERLLRDKLTLTQAGRWPRRVERNARLAFAKPPSRSVGGVHVEPGLPLAMGKREVVWYER